jgi:hypothetical protein
LGLFYGQRVEKGTFHVNLEVAQYLKVGSHQTNLIHQMKTTFLMFFFSMVISATIFAGVYVFFQSLVEAHAMAFSIGLVSIMVVGMLGMMNSIISDTTMQKQKIY